MKDYPNSTYQFNAEMFEPVTKMAYTKGVAWNYLTAESSPQYADNIEYLNLVSAEEYSATIEAFTYPDDFEAFSPTANVGKMSDEEEQQLLSDTATILKMDPPWDVTEDALHAAERALFAITKAVHHYKWHRQVLGDFWMARAVLVLKPYDAA